MQDAGHRLRTVVFHGGPCMDETAQLPDGRQTGSYPATSLPKPRLSYSSTLPVKKKVKAEGLPEPPLCQNDLREPGLRKFSRLRGRFKLGDGIKLGNAA